jgi:hypothetical protein
LDAAEKAMLLTEKSARLNKLTEYPEWQELVDTLAERKQRVANALAKRAMSPGGGITQDEIIRHQMFWGGVDAVLDTPGFVRQKLENAVRRAQRDEGDA